MKKTSILGVAAGLFVAVALTVNTTKAQDAADEPTFTAEAKGDELMIFSTSKTAKICTVRVIFSYKDGAGRREGTHSCTERQLPVGEHQAYCGAKSEHLVGAEVEGPVMSRCR